MNNQELKIIVNDILKNNIFKTFEDDKTLLIYDSKKGIYTNGIPKLEQICNDSPYFLNTPIDFGKVKFGVIASNYVLRDDFISPSGYVNLVNGVLNIKTMELLNKSSKYNFMEEIPITYDPNMKCPIFFKFIKDVIPKSDIKLLQKWFGYHFVHDNRFKFAMMFLGVKHSGKSLVISILENMFGISNFSHFELCEFNQSGSHAISNLFGKLGNTYSDMSMEMLKDIGKFKVLTGNDYISTRYAFKEPFSFKNYAKLTFSLNKCPLIHPCVNDDDAFWSRLGIILFNTPSYGIPDEDLNIKIVGGMTKDGKLYSGELSGILNWALEGYKLVLSEGFKEYPEKRTKIIWSKSMFSVFDEKQEPIQTKCSVCGKSMQNFHPEISEIITCQTCENRKNLNTSTNGIIQQI